MIKDVLDSGAELTDDEDYLLGKCLLSFDQFGMFLVLSGECILKNSSFESISHNLSDVVSFRWRAVL